jgi:hypothetical protein
MAGTDDSPIAAVQRRADALAARLNDADSFAEGGRAVAAEYDELVRAVRAVDARFAFDREGRPAAIAAVREALPMMERDLFDAVVDDHACEVAAVEEALFQIIGAIARKR